MFKVTGKQLKHMLHYMLREDAFLGHTEFYQIPGTIHFEYDRKKEEFRSLTWRESEVEEERIYTVGMQNFHFQNIARFFDISMEEIEKNQRPRMIATSCHDVILEYFNEHEWLDSEVDGRMSIVI